MRTANKDPNRLSGVFLSPSTISFFGNIVPLTPLLSFPFLILCLFTFVVNYHGPFFLAHPPLSSVTSRCKNGCYMQDEHSEHFFLMPMVSAGSLSWPRFSTHEGLKSLVSAFRVIFPGFHNSGFILIHPDGRPLSFLLRLTALHCCNPAHNGSAFRMFSLFFLFPFSEVTSNVLDLPGPPCPRLSARFPACCRPNTAPSSLL